MAFVTGFTHNHHAPSRSKRQYNVSHFPQSTHAHKQRGVHRQINIERKGEKDKYREHHWATNKQFAPINTIQLQSQRKNFWVTILGYNSAVENKGKKEYKSKCKLLRRSHHTKVLKNLEFRHPTFVNRNKGAKYTKQCYPLILNCEYNSSRDSSIPDFPITKLDQHIKLISNSS